MARKYTYQDVKEIVEQSGEKLLSKEDEITNERGFVTTRTKIKLWCGNHTHEPRITTLNCFLNGTRCRLCRVRMSDEEIKSIKLLDGYELISFDYINGMLNLTLKCPKKHEFKRTYSNFKNTKDCPICNNRYTFEEVEKMVKESGYSLLSKRNDLEDDKKCIKILTKILIKCPNPEHESYEVRLGDFLRGNRCKYCHFDKTKLTHQEVKEYIESFGYKLLSEYTASSNKILIRCPKGHEYEMAWGSFQQGRRCKYCSGNVKMTFQEGVELLQPYGYKMLTTEEEFENASKPVLLQCPYNHKPYYQNLSIFKCGHRCPCCNESKGERKIREVLISLNEDYVPQKKFNGLLGLKNGLLSYDFYLPKYNLLIEYQGEFHDGNLKGSYSKDIDRLEIQKEHDRRKREYAENNNIDLLEIWYWDFDNIEEILKRKLKL